jgi:hypothetical protein
MTTKSRYNDYVKLAQEGHQQALRSVRALPADGGSSYYATYYIESFSRSLARACLLATLVCSAGQTEKS